MSEANKSLSVFPDGEGRLPRRGEAEPLQELRRLLAAPNYSSWCALCQSFLQEELLPQVYQEVTARLHAWADELRALPSTWSLSPELAKHAAPFMREASLDLSLLDIDLSALLRTFSSLRQLALRGVSSEALSSLRVIELTHLTISGVELSSLSSVPFSQSLQQLKLSSCGLRDLMVDVLPKGLQALDLSGNQIESLAESAGALPMLQSLDLSKNPLATASLWESTSMPMLRSLDLSQVPHAAEPIYYMAKAPALCQQLRSLSLNECGVTDEQLESLIRRGDALTHLQELHLAKNPITEDGLSTLGRSLVGKRLRALSLSVSPELVGFELYLFSMLRALSLQAEGGAESSLSAEALRELPWAKLESLSLRGLCLGGELIEVLAESPASLASLDVSGNALSPRDLRRFLLECDLKNLRRLSLAENELGSAVAFLGEYESAYRVEHLDLGATRIDDVGLSALCEWLTSLVDEGFGLRSLSLSQNALSGAMIEALAQCRGVSLVTELRLSSCELDDERLSALLSSAHLSQLQRLDVSGNPLTTSISMALQRCASLVLSDSQPIRELCRRELAQLVRPITLSLR